MIVNIFKKQFLPIVCLLIAGICLSFTFFFMLRNREKLDIRAEILLDTQRLTNKLQRKIDTNLESLQSCHSFYQSSEEVTRKEFSEFVSSFLKRHIIIEVFAWLPKITLQQRKNFEESVRNSGFPDFGITEQDNNQNLITAKNRDVYYPVLYIEPFEGNEKALGFDLSSNPIRYEAMTKAIHSGSITASSKIKMVQEKDNQQSILVFIPVYHKNADVETLKQKHDNLMGFLVGAYRLPELLGGDNDYLDKKSIDVFYYYSSDRIENNLIYKKPCLLTKNSRNKDKREVFCSFSFPLTVADRTWSVVYEVNKNYILEKLSWNPWVILFCSLSITGLIGKYLIINHLRVDEIQELANILIDKNQELENVNQELDSFVYTASHDLSSPLKTITGFANILKEDYFNSLPAQAKDILNRIIKATNQMDTLIKDLLQLSRITRIQNPYEYVDLNNIISSVKERVCIDKDNFKARFKIMENFPKIYCDPTKITELFFNLISNAVKFSSKNDAPLIEIGYSEKNNCYEFFIKDNGIGIEKKYQDKIFDLFVRLHSESEYEGTGLGLTISKKIVNEHSGSIWVESEANKGAAFFFTLPKK